MSKPDSSSTIGQGMIYLSWVLLLILLTFAFNKYLEQQNNPNQQVSTKLHDNIAEVRLKQNRYSHYVANGQINNTPVTFLLDTGATLTSIPEKIANQLNLEKGYPSQSRTANGMITVYSTRLNTVGIGPIELKNIRATINPNISGDEVLLGMNFMKHLEMLQKGNELVLKYYLNP